MITKYMTRWNQIEPVAVLRETEKFVYIEGSLGKHIREAKRSDWKCYHDSWADAHQFLIKKAEANVASLRRDLEQANGKLGQIKGMKAPKE